MGWKWSEFDLRMISSQYAPIPRKAQARLYKRCGNSGEKILVESAKAYKRAVLLHAYNMP